MQQQVNSDLAKNQDEVALCNMYIKVKQNARYVNHYYDKDRCG